MSASYVRDTFYSWAQEVAALTGFAFYETVNRGDVKPRDAVWWTAQFFSIDFEGTFCTPGYRENGVIQIIVTGQPGTGDIPIVQALEEIVPAMIEKVDPTGRLVLETHEPVEEASQGSADRGYRIAVDVNYAHSL